MKSFLLPIFLLSAFTPYVNAQTDLCQAQKANLMFHFTGPSTVHAGDNIKISAHVDVKDFSLLSQFKDVTLRFDFINKLIGSNGLLWYEFLSRQKTTTPIDFEFRSTIPENYKGHYSFSVFVSFVEKGEHVPVCYYRTSAKDEVLFVDVLNDDAKTDIDPPILTNVAFSGNTVQAGETFRIHLDASDKSALRIGDNPNPGVFDYSRHIQFENKEDSSQSFHEYASSPMIDAEGKLYSDVLVPVGTKPGVYKLTIFNLGDIWGNGCSAVPDSMQREIEVIATDDLVTL